MKVGITFSAFDLLHAGHVKMLEEAKRQCGYLICGLQTDPTIDRPILPLPKQKISNIEGIIIGCVLFSLLILIMLILKKTQS